MLEKEIIERLTRIEAHVENLVNIEQEHSLLLRGNGKDGLVVRLDRLEQTGRKQSWTLRALFLALLTALAAVFGLK